MSRTLLPVFLALVLLRPLVVTQTTLSPVEQRIVQAAERLIGALPARPTG